MTTEIHEVRVDSIDLRLGMYVCRLDRPWEGTPFPLQGLQLLVDEDLRAIRELCKYVYIDMRRQVEVDARLQLLGRRSSPDTRFSAGIRYTNSVSIEDELPRAHKALKTSAELVDRIYVDIASGRELSADTVEQAVRPLVSSVLRNPDAFLYVESLRKHDSYSYSHAINCSALAAVLGRHMGFAEDTIVSVASGGLLMDIGKTQLSESLLQYPGSLSAGQVELVRSHVASGLSLLGVAGIADTDVLDIVSTHHERYDGSGYPYGISGNGIPIVGRMLGVIDAYDAMASARPYRPAISRHHAMQQIYAARSRMFQSELVEQFLVCLGVYPTGSLVELNSGEVAIVMMQNKVRRLRPRVLVLTTAGKQQLKHFHVLDLMDQDDATKTVEIKRSIAPGDFGIDVGEQFLQ